MFVAEASFELVILKLKCCVRLKLGLALMLSNSEGNQASVVSDHWIDEIRYKQLTP